jgi:hypothetical protein
MSARNFLDIDAGPEVPPDPKCRRSIRDGSLLGAMKRMRVGDRHYAESTIERYAALQRQVGTYVSRKDAGLGGRKFSTALFTAVSASRAGDVRHLVCIERTT